MAKRKAACGRGCWYGEENPVNGAVNTVQVFFSPMGKGFETFKLQYHVAFSKTECLHLISFPWWGGIGFRSSQGSSYRTSNGPPNGVRRCP